MVTADSCPFCRIVEDREPGARILYRDSAVVAFFPRVPATTGHTLVIPHRHVPDINDLAALEVQDLAVAVQRVSAALTSALHPGGLNVIQSNGDAATQTVAHVHFHLVPRTPGDHLVLAWPDRPSDPPQVQDQTLLLLRQHLSGPEEEESPADRRQHLSFIQAAIARMSQASASAKTWLLPIVTASFGYAIVTESWGVAFLGSLAVLVFGLLDSNYLKQERAFRALYAQVARGAPVPSFTMNPSGSNVNYWPAWADVRSWAVLPFYGPLLLVGIAIVIWLGCR